MDAVTQSAQIEWNNIKTSLKMCGDVGDFDADYVMTNPGPDGEELSEFKENLVDLSHTFEQHDYTTLEAMGVYCRLVRLAVERIGLSGRVAAAFANGYSYIRTGWALDTDTSIEQNLFYKMFFQSREDHGWEFDSPVIQERLKEIFGKFMSWDKDPLHYASEVEIYREMKQDEAEEAD